MSSRCSRWEIESDEEVIVMKRMFVFNNRAFLIF